MDKLKLGRLAKDLANEFGEWIRRSAEGDTDADVFLSDGGMVMDNLVIDRGSRGGGWSRAELAELDDDEWAWAWGWAEKYATTPLWVPVEPAPKPAKKKGKR